MNGFIRDVDCAVDTPVVFGMPNTPIYGTGRCVSPAVVGKQSTPFERSTYLSALLPLEDYHRIIVLFSGGKDSLAAYEVLRELGVPKEKIELWHHDIDGGHPQRRMDWPVTAAYVRAFAQAEGVHLRCSWRQNGFFGELYRQGASYPVLFEEDAGAVRTCALTPQQLRSRELRGRLRNPVEQAELESYGKRGKFPAKSGNLSVRWCSAYLKIAVADSVIRNLESCSGSRILIVSGERRGESAGRSRYNEIELHRTHAVKKSNRLVHVWRPVIDYHEGDVWAVLKRNNIRPHPCYSAGWNRCSCMMCIFSRPEHWAGIRELFPKDFAALREDEHRLGFTIDNTADLDTFIGDARSCVRTDSMAIQQLITGHFSAKDVYTAPGTWRHPAGAFHGGEGGPC